MGREEHIEFQGRVIEVLPAGNFRIELENGHQVLAHLGGKQVKADMDTKRKWYAMLLWHEDFKKYKMGWAARQYREKFGVWPNGLHVQPIEPDAQVRSWIKYSIIKWVKGQEKGKKVEEAAQHAA